MAIEEIVCPVCGYSALYVSVGNKGSIKTDAFEMTQKCKNFGTGEAGLGCEHFDKAVLAPRPAQ